MLKKLGILLAAFFLTTGTMTGCTNPKPDDVASKFTEMLGDSATVGDISEANSYLTENYKYLDKEQTGGLLLALEETSLKIDNSSFDYETAIKVYGDNIPDYVSKIFELKDEEQRSPIISGAALQISWAELLDRTDSVEDFIRENVDETMIKEDALWLYKRQVNALLMGASNSPIFDYKTHEFSGEVRELYENYIKNHPDTTLAWVLTEYRRYLDSIGYKLEYEDKDESVKFFDTCSRLVADAEKRVYLSAG